MVIKTTAEGRMPYRGPRSAKPKTWEERCKGWLHGALKKKDETGRFKITSIVDRHQKDPAFVVSFNEEMQKEFGRDSDINDAYEADELAEREKIIWSA